MKQLFEPVTVGCLSLKNRLIRSATFEGAFDEQESFASELIKRYEQLALGGIGAIITGMVGIDKNSRVLPSMVKAYGETFVPELKKITERVHALDTKIIVQISHCGLKAGQSDDGGPALGPSEWEKSPEKVVKAMSHEDIRSAVSSFATAAAHCQAAGADAVQIHGAHGYLLSEFLNPFFNHRTDEYGGGIENRARIVFEVYEAVRATVGPNYPVWIKLNSKDLTEPSISSDEFLWLGGELDKRGIAAIEVSGGAAVNARTSSMQVVRNEEDEGCFADEALKLADKTSVSIISVCGFRTPDIIEKWLNKGKLQAVSMCRPLISEPDLARRWQSGNKTKSRCISCNKCFSPGEGVECRAFAKIG